MRNLKRVLALAMAMVMTLGMMVIGANAASYADAAQIDDNYAEAIEVLTGMGVFQGQGEDSFAPKAILTRAEASALIYRVLTGDVKDGKKDLYDYSSFKDVPEGKWYTGYVTYAANGGYIKGYGDGNFGPSDKVTGVQVLAIMLRAIGYGQKGEYEGAGWKDNVLTDAFDNGMLTGIATNDLDKGATRELVAQLLFNALTEPYMVTYTPALGYIPVSLTAFSYTQTLGEKVFGLNYTADQDAWGRPSVVWYNDKNGDDVLQRTGTNKETVYATLAEKPVAVYTTAVTECQVASDTTNKDETYTTYLNGVDNKTTGVLIEAKDTVNKIGAQGRLTEVYEDVIVYIDTYLAKVDDVKDATYDAAGHLKTASALYLTVYDGRTPNIGIVEYNGATNYTYSKGDYILVNAVGKELAHPNYVKASTSAVDGAYYTADHLEILGVAPSTTDTYTGYNTLNVTTTIGTTTYPDANTFYLNNTKATIGATYVWFFDNYGNVIGKVTPAAAAAQYAIVTAIAYEHNGLSSSYVDANLVTFGGDKLNGVLISGIVNANNQGSVAVTGTPAVTSNAEYNGAYYIGETNDSAPYYFFTYTYNTTRGTYALTPVQATKSALKNVSQNVALLDTDSSSILALGNSKTVYLVYDGANYTSYTGYTTLPTMTNVDIYYVLGSVGNYASYVYIDASKATTTAGTSTGYIFAGEDFGDVVIGGTTYNIYRAWVNGVPTYFYATAAQMSGIGNNFYTYGVDANGCLLAIDVMPDVANSKYVAVTGTHGTDFYFDGTVIQKGFVGYNVVTNSAPVYKIDFVNNTITTYASGSAQAEAAIKAATAMMLFVDSTVPTTVNAVYITG